MNEEKLLSIIIPIFNEEKTLLKVLENVQKFKKNLSSIEVIAVNDGSTDNSLEILNENSHLYDSLINNPFNKGKGSAARDGLEVAIGKYITFQDADLEYDPKDYKKLLEPFYSKNADVVYGSRFFGGESRRIIYFKNQLANKFLTFISNIFTGLNLTDMETGYKCFTKEAIKNINLIEKSFGFEPEITAKLAKKKPKLAKKFGYNPNRMVAKKGGRARKK